MSLIYFLLSCVTLKGFCYGVFVLYFALFVTSPCASSQASTPQVAIHTNIVFQMAFSDVKQYICLSIA